MKDKVSPNRRTGRMIAKNLIILLTLVIILCVGMWAWFTSATDPIADGVSVVCEAPDGIDIAVVSPETVDPPADDSELWQHTVTLSPENYPFVNDLFMTEITGDGKTFAKPALTQVGNTAVVDTSTEWSDATANSDYLSFKLFVRSKSKLYIQLDKNSVITPLSTTLAWDSGTTAAASLNPSAYGPFSRDCIVGAARFSVLDNNNNRKLLWIPAPQLSLATDYSLLTTDKSSGDTYSHSYYDSTKTRATITDVVTNADAPKTNFDYSMGSVQDIVYLENSPANSKYYINYAICNLWIEGEDNEARLATVGGNFSVTLKLKIDRTR